MTTQSAEADRVVVVGAGMAGLTAAVTLASAGAKVVLFEASAVLGGRLATLDRIEFEQSGRVWSFPDEHGLHGVWRQYRNLQRLLRTHGLDGGFRPAGEQGLVVGPGHIVEIGERVRRSRLPNAAAQLSLLSDRRFFTAAVQAGPVGLARVGWGLLSALAFRHALDAGGDLDRISVAEYTRRWPPVLERMMGALTHAAFFRDPSEVSLAAFLTGLELYVLQDKRNSDFEVARRDSFTALLGPLAQALRRCGGEVRLGVAVAGVEVDARARVRGVRCVDGDRLDARAVVLAVDPSAFARLRFIDPHGGAMTATRRLGLALAPEHLAAPSTVVRLFFARAPSDRGPVSGVFSGGHADTYFWLDGLQDDFAAWAEATDGAVVECHLYGRNAEACAGRTDDEIARDVLETARAAWPELSPTWLHARVRRNPRTHSTFPPGTFGRLPGVTTPVDGVALCGDWIATRAPALYLERATLTGLLAARALAPMLGLEPEWMPAPLAPDGPTPSVAAWQHFAHATGLR